MKSFRTERSTWLRVRQVDHRGEVEAADIVRGAAPVPCEMDALRWLRWEEVVPKAIAASSENCDRRIGSRARRGAEVSGCVRSCGGCSGRCEVGGGVQYLFRELGGDAARAAALLDGLRIVQGHFTMSCLADKDDSLSVRLGADPLLSRQVAQAVDGEASDALCSLGVFWSQ
jgi:hypothetical protein